MKGGTIKKNANVSEKEADEAARRLKKAMKGFGTDERVIIQILTQHNEMDRNTIVDRYKALHGKDLKEEVKDEISGHFEDAALALLEYENHYLAQWCHRAIKGLGTDESVLIEILCGCKQDKVNLISDSYKYLYGRSLEEDIKNDLSGELRQLIIALLQGARDEDDARPSEEKAKQIAQELYEAGEGMNGGTDEDEFIRILANTSYSQLKKVIEVYTPFAENTLENAIQKEFSGKIRDALITLVLSVKDQVAFFAKTLHRGKESTITRVIVTRSEIDLEDIKDAYKKMYKTPLADDIKAKTKGEYRKLLLAIIK